MEVDRMRQYLEAIRSQLQPGSMSVIDVQHDARCPCSSGDEPLLECSCDPWLVLEGKRYRLDAAGQLQLVTLK